MLEIVLNLILTVNLTNKNVINNISILIEINFKNNLW